MLKTQDQKDKEAAKKQKAADEERLKAEADAKARADAEDEEKRKQAQAGIQPILITMYNGGTFVDGVTKETYEYEAGTVIEVKGGEGGFAHLDPKDYYRGDLVKLKSEQDARAKQEADKKLKAEQKAARDAEIRQATERVQAQKKKEVQAKAEQQRLVELEARATWITMKQDGSFTGRISRHQYIYKAWQQVKVLGGKEDIPHLDPNDYIDGKVEKPKPQKKR